MIFPPKGIEVYEKLIAGGGGCFDMEIFGMGDERLLVMFVNWKLHSGILVGR